MKKYKVSIKRINSKFCEEGIDFVHELVKRKKIEKVGRSIVITRSKLLKLLKQFMIDNTDDFVLARSHAAAVLETIFNKDYSDCSMAITRKAKKLNDIKEVMELFDYFLDHPEEIEDQDNL